MKKYAIDLLVYRWRYVLGYGSLTALLVFAMIIASLYSPGGLSGAEIAAMATGGELSLANLATPNLPFHSLQHAIFSLFGVSILTVKLPSIIFSLAASIAIFFLLRRWFKPSITILSMLIITATSQYLFVSQSATPSVLYVLYSALILLFVSLIMQNVKRPATWKVGLGASLALSLYTPYFIYINIGLVIVALIHPHTRYFILKKQERANWITASVVFIALIMPLMYMSASNPELISQLLGIASFANIDLIAGTKQLLYTYFWIEPIVLNGKILPILDYSALAISALGVVVLIKNHHTARAYMIGAWTALTIPLLIVRPDLTSITIVPLIILLAVGLETLLHEWYKLFPKNPYARGTGLLFTVALVTVMVVSGIDRFSNGYRYMPTAAREFNDDISLIKRQIEKQPVRTLIVVSKSEKPLYEALSHYNYPELGITTATISEGNRDNIGNAIVTHAARKELIQSSWTLQGVVTNDRYYEADRLYLYKTAPDEVQ